MTDEQIRSLVVHIAASVDWRSRGGDGLLHVTLAFGDGVQTYEIDEDGGFTVRDEEFT